MAARTKPKLSLTHLTRDGEAHMVDVGAKKPSARKATARARVHVSEETFLRLASGDTPKGDVLAVARVSGIQAAKRTSELIPLCHSLALTRVDVSIELVAGTIVVDATAEALDRTGVEMEALTAASVTALTLYDMLKSIDRSMSFDVALTQKTGGRSGRFERARQ